MIVVGSYYLSLFIF